MRMTAADTKKYPKMAYYVKNNIPDVVKAPGMMSAMRKIGQLKKNKLVAALKWGQGPEIKVTALVNAEGEFSPGIRSNEIRVDTNLVRNFESGIGIRKSRAGNVYLLGVTLLHELVHWGDDQDGVDRNGEEGAEFEKLIYGRVID